MLEGLDKIDWKSLRHAYGPATDTPAHLRALTSSNAGEREEARIQLGGSIYHQGTVYSATSYAVPFLFEVMDATATDEEDKESVASLLLGIAASRGYDEVHAPVLATVERQARDPKRGFVARIFSSTAREEPPGDFSAKLAEERRAVSAVRRAISPRLLDLLERASHSKSYLREALVHAAANYPEHASVTLPLLQSALAAETEENNRAAITEAIAKIEGAGLAD